MITSRMDLINNHNHLYLHRNKTGAIPKYNKSSINESDVCIKFHSKYQPTTKEEVFSKLGANAVISFVGDSNTRILFLEALSFFGHPHWVLHIILKTSFIFFSYLITFMPFMYYNDDDDYHINPSSIMVLFSPFNQIVY